MKISSNFLAFGLLCLITLSCGRNVNRYQKVHRIERIKHLPGVSNIKKPAMYSGYLHLQKNTAHLFYWLVEAEKKNNDKLILWLNGGPGCSSMYGLLNEHGPYAYDTKSKNLTRNRYSWNRLANVLYLDSPVGTGFSYSTNDTKATDLSDTFTAKLNLEALNSFMNLYSRFKNFKLYLAGESYAGIYINTLASLIIKHKGQLKKQLKGVFIGNALLNSKLNEEKQIEYLYYHGIISKNLHSRMMDNNCLEKKKENIQSICLKAKNELQATLNDPALGIYNYMNEPFCKTEASEKINKEVDYYSGYYDYDDYNSSSETDVENTSGKNNWNLTEVQEMELVDKINEKSKILSLENMENGMVVGWNTLKEIEQKLLVAKSRELENRKTIVEQYVNMSLMKQEELKCVVNVDYEEFLRRKEVQKAIHSKNIRYKACTEVIARHYNQTVQDVSKQVYSLYQKGVAILLYYGDQDIMCPFLAGEAFAAQLGIKHSLSRRPWYTYKNGYKIVGGYYEKYGNLWTATIKGAGHMAPLDKPFETFTLIRRFLKRYNK